MAGGGRLPFTGWVRAAPPRHPCRCPPPQAAPLAGPHCRGSDSVAAAATSVPLPGSREAPALPRSPPGAASPPLVAAAALGVRLVDGSTGTPGPNARVAHTQNRALPVFGLDLLCLSLCRRLGRLLCLCLHCCRWCCRCCGWPRLLLPVELLDTPKVGLPPPPLGSLALWRQGLGPWLPGLKFHPDLSLPSLWTLGTVHPESSSPGECEIGFGLDRRSPLVSGVSFVGVMAHPPPGAGVVKPLGR